MATLSDQGRRDLISGLIATYRELNSGLPVEKQHNDRCRVAQDLERVMDFAEGSSVHRTSFHRNECCSAEDLRMRVSRSGPGAPEWLISGGLTRSGPSLDSVSPPQVHNRL